MTVLQAPAETSGGAAAANVKGHVHSWELVTRADGPGTRLVTWLTGCSLRCLYCHNPDTWMLNSGPLSTVEQHARVLARYRNFVIAAGGGMTLSGGEPLLQPAFAAGLF